jgi:hypothetical protein
MSTNLSRATLEALALFWLALARDGLGEREEATALWRQVRDHPFANASDPLLSTRAAHNLSIQAAHIGQDATSEREALTCDLLRQLSNPTPAPSALTRIAYEQVQLLASGNHATGIAQLAPVVLELADARPGLLSDDQVLQLRIWNVESQLVTGDAPAAALSYHALANGGAPALGALDGWASRLQAAGDDASPQSVLVAAHLRILVLHELGRPADAAKVRKAALRTQAARNPQLVATVDLIRDASEHPYA